MSGDIIYKMTGSGNDFVFLDGRSCPPEGWPPERIAAVCARGTGVGADGIVVLEPGSESGRVRFHFFNSDGSRADMCGNAALCATRLAAWLELGPPDGMILETDAGLVETRCLEGEGERAEIVLPAVTEIVEPQIPLAPGERLMGLTRVGVPHLVVEVADLAAVPLMPRGRELRFHPGVGPAGANVNFVGRSEEGWRMRTYERGVEAETLACGTGAAACAAVLLARQNVQLPWHVRSAAGAILTISGQHNGGRLSQVRLAGEGRMVFRGMLV